jgi:hypothetical protein
VVSYPQTASHPLGFIDGTRASLHCSGDHGSSLCPSGVGALYVCVIPLAKLAARKLDLSKRLRRIWRKTRSGGNIGYGRVRGEQEGVQLEDLGTARV